MLRTPTGGILALALLVLAGRATDAQTPSVADAALATQNAAFLALPEATRKAAQDALVWLGFYNGAVDGDFGKRTRDALLAYQASVKAPTDGALSAPELKALLAAAEKARDAVGFKLSPTPSPARKPAFRPNSSAGATGRSSTSLRAQTPISAPSTPASPPQRQAAGSPTRQSSPTVSSLSRGRTGRRPSIPGSTRTRRRARRFAASPSPIPRRRPPSSTGSRSRSPIRSSRFRKSSPRALRPRRPAAPSRRDPARRPPSPIPRRPQPRSSSRPARR